MQSGTLNRPQPLLVSATTAGQDRDSWCYSQHELFEQHLRGTLSEPSYWDERFVFIAMCDEKDDPADEAVWVKANPNLGVSVDLDGLRSQAAEFKNDPQALFSFQRFHLNIWNSVVTGHSLPQDKIAACGGLFPDKKLRDAVEARKYFLERAEDTRFRLCGGFDLGLSDDLAAFVVVAQDFPMDGGKKMIACPWFWVPGKNLRLHETSWRIPLSQWVREGWVKVAGEELVDIDLVSQDIKTLCATYRIPVLGYDRWKSETMMSKLMAEKVVQPVAVAQLPSLLTTPCRYLKTGILNSTILTWAIRCSSGNCRTWTSSHRRKRVVSNPQSRAGITGRRLTACKRSLRRSRFCSTLRTSNGFSGAANSCHLTGGNKNENHHARHSKQGRSEDRSALCQRPDVLRARAGQ